VTTGLNYNHLVKAELSFNPQAHSYRGTRSRSFRQIGLHQTKMGTCFGSSTVGATIRPICSRQIVSISSLLIVTISLAASSSSLVAEQQTSTRTLSKSDNQVLQTQSRQQQQDQRAALEAELNSIVRQHDSLDNKQLAEAIISRLMVDNLTGSTLFNTNNDLDGEIVGIDTSEVDSNELLGDSSISQHPTELERQTNALAGLTGPEATRLKKLLSLLQNYEASLVREGSDEQVYSPFPALPSSQAATMKRAAIKMGNYLHQQQQQQQQQQHHHNGYATNLFDFGLGKRPDSGVSGGILRFGDSSLGLNGGGQVQPASQFGKRPSAHRYDFGLGKRVASVSILPQVY